MITISKKDNSVMIEVHSKWPLAKTYLFYWECNREDFAQLLTENLRIRMENEIERIRCEEYNNGWRDAKSKKVAKKTWFSNLWR